MYGIYYRPPNKEKGQLKLKRPELPYCFQGRGFKGSVREWASECYRLMHNSQIGWHQGEVSSIIDLLVSTSLGSMCCGQQFSSGEGLLPVKTT